MKLRMLMNIRLLVASAATTTLLCVCSLCVHIPAHSIVVHYMHCLLKRCRIHVHYPSYCRTQDDG